MIIIVSNKETNVTIQSFMKRMYQANKKYNAIISGNWTYMLINLRKMFLKKITKIFRKKSSYISCEYFRNTKILSNCNKGP